MPSTGVSQAEAKLQLGNGKAAVKAYAKAMTLTPSADFELLQGLAGALIADGRPQQVTPPECP